MGAASSGLASAATGGATDAALGLPVGASAIDNATGGNLNGLLGGALQDPFGTLQGLGSRAGASFGINGLARPQLADVQQGTSVEDVKNAQSGVQNSLQSQQALLSALQGQNGLGMQSQAAGYQQSLANQLAGANGVGAQQSAIQGLQGTAGQYQDIAQGRGPNPAQAAFNQATGQNVANQAALMAGQRGAGANVGLLSRQAAQQGAGIQQQAAGQLATQQAQQQLNALSGLSGAQQAIGGLGAGLTGQQAGANNAYAGQSNQLAGQQIGANQAIAQNQLANQQQMQGALQGQNQANVANQASVNAANAGIAQQQIKGQQGIVGGVANGLGSFIGVAEGGLIQKMAEGGEATESAVDPMAPISSFGKFLKGFGVAQAPVAGGEGGMGEQSVSSGFSNLGKGMASQMMAAKGGLAATGGPVKASTPAQKAEKPGNSYDNDKVPAMLSEGEIVIPRSIVMGKNPEIAAAKFVRETLAKRNRKA